MRVLSTQFLCDKRLDLLQNEKYTIYNILLTLIMAHRRLQQICPFCKSLLIVSMEDTNAMTPPTEQTKTKCQLYIFTGRLTVPMAVMSSPVMSLRLLYFFESTKKKIGGKTKLSKVMVVAPMRFRIAPKFGRERPITKSTNMQADRKIAFFNLEPKSFKIF